MTAEQREAEAEELDVTRNKDKLKEAMERSRSKSRSESQLSDTSSKFYITVHYICNQFLDGCTPKRKRRVTIGRTEEMIRKMEEERSAPKKKEKEVELEDLFKSQTGTLEFIA